MKIYKLNFQKIRICFPRKTKTSKLCQIKIQKEKKLRQKKRITSPNPRRSHCLFQSRELHRTRCPKILQPFRKQRLARWWQNTHEKLASRRPKLDAKRPTFFYIPNKTAISCKTKPQW